MDARIKSGHEVLIATPVLDAPNNADRIEMNSDKAAEVSRDYIRSAASDPSQVTARMSLAQFTATVFEDVASELHLAGHFLGKDRLEGCSPFGHGSDSTVAVSMLLKIASQLVSASADLIADGRHYAGAALVRQLVEVEYLAWAFETKDEEASRWLRSKRDERKSFFTPAKLRAAAGKRFRSVDYGYHCELGGHPVPGSWMLLNDDVATAQLMLSDCLGHSGRIWDHTIGWAASQAHCACVLSKAPEMLLRYSEWKKIDRLTSLPPPPPDLLD